MWLSLHRDVIKGKTRLSQVSASNMVECHTIAMNRVSRTEVNRMDAVRSSSGPGPAWARGQRFAGFAPELSWPIISTRASQEPWLTPE
ncbi:hypothetical protein VTN77DRAFT_968 [Rasamsonia byssochlamydoides]|uniref:uncharacterized protein n=1 Tax=Rasamsonia byssochlamydoides TaxID=89139 RepID=UPI0037447880